jgi:hypothetical protein
MGRSVTLGGRHVSIEPQLDFKVSGSVTLTRNVVLQAKGAFPYVLDCLSSLVQYLNVLQLSGTESAIDNLFEKLVIVHFLSLAMAVLIPSQVKPRPQCLLSEPLKLLGSLYGIQCFCDLNCEACSQSSIIYFSILMLTLA